jgi:hypothetical protein
MTTAVESEPVPIPMSSGIVAMDREGQVRILRGGAIAAAILRIGIGLIYSWALIAQGFGVGYTNQW